MNNLIKVSSWCGVLVFRKDEGQEVMTIFYELQREDVTPTHYFYILTHYILQPLKGPKLGSGLSPSQRPHKHKLFFSMLLVTNLCFARVE